MRQSACLVFNPIMVDNYAAFFNCTPVGGASDSMMVVFFFFFFFFFTPGIKFHHGGYHDLFVCPC